MFTFAVHRSLTGIHLKSSKETGVGNSRFQVLIIHNPCGDQQAWNANTDTWLEMRSLRR
jgi:hypothetical protein